MSGSVTWDARWIGTHGIARHATEVTRRLTGSYRHVKPGRVAPTSPVDPIYLRSVLRLGAGDLFVTPGFNAALPGRFRQLLTVHDLIHLRVADESSCVKRAYYEGLVRPVIRSTRRVLTVSEFSRREIIDWSGLDPEDVVTVGNGSSIAAATEDELDARSRAQKRTVLFVGNAKPHKNLDLLIAAVRHLPDDVRVVTVGVTPEHVARRCAELGAARGRFDVMPGISDGELRRLYLGAACVALPSTYEGFGLAALEGMATGTPTAYVCEAVDEVVGDQGFRCRSASDGEEFATAVEQAMTLDRAARARLVQESGKFSWAKAAERVERQINELST